MQALKQKLKDFTEGTDASGAYVEKTKDELIALQDAIKQKLSKLMAQEVEMTKKHADLKKRTEDINKKVTNVELQISMVEDDMTAH